jgi:phage terminase large subunit-like protein
VAALYQQGRVYHIGTFPQFEDQMTNFTSDIDRAAAGYSPDRVDALVWAFVPGKRGADMVGASALACRYQ